MSLSRHFSKSVITTKMHQITTGPKATNALPFGFERHIPHSQPAKAHRRHGCKHKPCMFVSKAMNESQLVAESKNFSACGTDREIVLTAARCDPDQ